MGEKKGVVCFVIGKSCSVWLCGTKNIAEKAQIAKQQKAKKDVCRSNKRKQYCQ